MLKKLIKYEWKETSKISCIMLLAMLAVTIIGCLMLNMPWMKEFYAGGVNMSELETIGVVLTLMGSLMLYVFMLVGITYGIFIFLGVHFFKTMYTDQGYLTHTLPVSANQLLVSKTLVSGIWYVLIEIGVILSVVALVVSLVNGAMTPADAEVWGTLWEELTYIFDVGMGSFIVQYIIWFVLTMLISPFTGIIMLFGALTIGQLSKKHKALMGLLAYFGISGILMIVNMVVEMIYMFGVTMNSLAEPVGLYETGTIGMYYSMLIVQVVAAVILYWASHRIITRKLNMD